MPTVTLSTAPRQADGRLVMNVERSMATSKSYKLRRDTHAITSQDDCCDDDYSFSPERAARIKLLEEKLTPEHLTYLVNKLPAPQCFYDE